MQKPNLDQMWETFIKIPMNDRRIGHSLLYDLIRTKIQTLISRLKHADVIDWYCFLIHNRNSGVPTTKDDENLYFHIRFSVKADVKPNKALELLPSYCCMTRHIEPRPDIITGIDKSTIQHGDIAEAWRIIGEQSEWFLDVLNIHKRDVDIPRQQIAQFLHFFANMACQRVA